MPTCRDEMGIHQSSDRLFLLRDDLWGWLAGDFSGKNILTCEVALSIEERLPSEAEG